MANMSYCRFENTSRDLQDCIYAMEEAVDLPALDLNQYEKSAFEGMRAQCQRFIEEHDRLMAASTEAEIPG